MTGMQHYAAWNRRRKRVLGGGGAPSGGVPQDLGATAWWDERSGITADGESAGDEITAWTDRIAGATVTPDQANNPTRGPDGRGVDFATLDRMTNTTFTSTRYLHDGSGGSVWMRVTPTVDGFGRMFGTTYSGAGGPGIFIERISGGTGWLQVGSSTGFGYGLNQFNSPPPFATIDAEADLTLIVSNENSGLNRDFYQQIQGENSSPQQLIAAGLTDDQDAVGVCIGGFFNSTSACNTTFHQLAFFDRVLTSEEIAQLEAWDPYA